MFRPTEAGVCLLSWSNVATGLRLEFLEGPGFQPRRIVSFVGRPFSSLAANVTIRVWENLSGGRDFIPSRSRSAFGRWQGILKLKTSPYNPLKSFRDFKALKSFRDMEDI